MIKGEVTNPALASGEAGHGHHRAVIKSNASGLQMMNAEVPAKCGWTDSPITVRVKTSWTFAMLTAQSILFFALLAVFGMMPDGNMTVIVIGMCAFYCLMIFPFMKQKLSFSVGPEGLSQDFWLVQKDARWSEIKTIRSIFLFHYISGQGVKNQLVLPSLCLVADKEALVVALRKFCPAKSKIRVLYHVPDTEQEVGGPCHESAK